VSVKELLTELGLVALVSVVLFGVLLLIGLFQRGWGLKRDSYARRRVDCILDWFVEEDYTFKKHFLLRFAGLTLVLFLALQLLRWLR